jgi:PPOX class probable F420-dependent enzyme
VTVTLGEVARGLVDGVNTGVLATNNPDGSPQSSVVWVARDGDELLISTEAGRRKDSNLRKDPRASLLVIDKTSADRYVEIRGIATVTEDIGRAVAQQLAEIYAGPGAGQEYVDLPPQITRTVIRITPHKVIVHV